MDDDDTRMYWEMMFWHFHGLGEAEVGQLFGRLLQGRFEATTRDLPPTLDELLRRLEATEQAERAGRSDEEPD